MPRLHSHLLALGIFVLAVARPVPARALEFGAHLEAGFSSTTVRPLVRQNAPGGTLCIGIGIPMRAGARMALEYQVTAGGEMGASIPEDPIAGHRNLTTLLVGPEFGPAHDARGPFGFFGVGSGRSVSNRARGWFEPPFDVWLIPPRQLSAFAAGAAIGYRTIGGPGPFGCSIALREQLMPHSGQVIASATSLTFGLAY